MKYLTLILFLFCLAACQKNADQATPELTHAFDKEIVRDQMRSLVYSYGDAIEQMDTGRTISHFLEDPEFYIYADGEHFTFTDMKKAVKNGFFAGLKKVEIHWDTVNIRVLSENEAICLMRITQTLTDINDVKTRVAAEATFVGINKNKQGWKVAYGHAAHKVLTEKN